MNMISRLLISFGAVAVTAAASSYFTLSGITGWYGMAEKAPLTPPSEWFRIIWGILYLLMAFSYYLVLGKPRTAKTLEAGLAVFQPAALSDGLVFLLLLSRLHGSRHRRAAFPGLDSPAHDRELCSNRQICRRVELPLFHLAAFCTVAQYFLCLAQRRKRGNLSGFFAILSGQIRNFALI